MISSLRLQNFRSYRDDSFEFSEGVNIIIGPNASGKTNILEGLVYVCTGAPFRSASTEIIRHGANWSRLDGLTSQNQVRIAKLQIGPNDKLAKTFIINDTEKRRLPFSDTIPVVLFEPNDLQHLTTSPERRRNFVDTILRQVDAEFGQQARNYTRVLAQRNRLLKQPPGMIRETVFAWNVRLSELGGQIATKRIKLLDQLNQGLGESYSRLANKKHSVNLAYESGVPQDQYASQMLKDLELNLESDTARGFTSVGPHRDDISITINKKSLNSFASRGETRTALLALKIEETQIIEKQRDQKPLLMLDDVFSELDGARRKSLTTFIGDYQSFITTTDADVVSKKFTKHARLISLG